MINKCISVIAGFILLPLLVHAQAYRLSDKPDEFIVDVATMMASTKNDDAIRVGKDLEAVWSGLSQDQRQKVVAISKKMQTKKYRPNPHFKLFFEAVSKAVTVQNIAAAEMNRFLDVSDKVVGKYDNKEINIFLETIASFFRNRSLYHSNYNRLYVTGGTYTFVYKDNAVAAPVVETPQPNNTNTESNPNDGWFTDWNTESTSQTNGDVAAAPVNEFVFMKTPQPEVQGAVIEFTGVDLVFATNHDSVRLAGTQGTIMLNNNTFVGKGGKFDWSMAGMSDVYCDFKEYNFNVKSPRLTAEEVTLNYPKKLKAPIEGVFEYVSKSHKGPDDAQYPRFMSLYSDVDVKELGKNLVYKGGFSLVGRRIYSTSLSNRPSTLNYVENGEVKFKTAGRKYEFGDSLILSPQISVVIPHNRDSIYHPAVKLTYNKNIPMLRLNSHDGRFKNTPFVDTYYQVDMTIEGVQWDMNTDSINFYIVTARNEVPAVFESFDFYDSTRYVSLKGLNNFHPLQMLMSYSKNTGKNSFYIGEVATALKLNENVVRGAMMQMMQQGYVDFNEETGYVHMNRKGDHNVLVNSKKRDYDSFRIESVTPKGYNATVNLGSNILTVRGVDKFYLSNKLNVYITPRKKEIQLLQNRNFLLDGELAAGNFKFKGSGFFFLYDEFTVEMPQIDTILFTPKETKKSGKNVELGSEIRYGAGTLYINKPNNKAGLKDYPEYPRLNVESGATIYFDQSDRVAGSYNRNVRFEIPKVDMDSLNSKNPTYKGKFYSDGIFPPFEESLVAMADNTLGFKHTPPPGGYQLYGSDSKVTFEGDMVMDMKGIRAAGTIKHLSTTLSSKDILFTPDSVVAKGPLAEIQETTIGSGAFPKVTVKDYKLKWLARADSMIISNTSSPFEIYKQNGSSYTGNVVVRSNGLFGSGTLNRKDSEIYSPRFHFDQTRFSAQDAEFRIKSNIVTKPVLHANFVNVDFDMAQGLAVINTSTNPAVAGFASLEFPYASYRTSIGKAKWDINKKSIVMEGDVKSTTFTSINPDHENLTFNARFALYNIEKYTLNIGGVPFIQAADARILPKSGVVRILENGIMEPLKEAQLVIDTVHAYHNLYDGQVQILSRSKFVGNATYKYTNSDNQSFGIKLGDFELRQDAAKSKREQPLQYTAAAGTITEEDQFLIAPRLLFKGNVTMTAPEKSLKFEGAIKLDLKSQGNLGTWLPYTSGQENIVINVDDKLNAGGTPLMTGLHIDRSNSSIYTTFLSEKHYADDPDIFTAKGQLAYVPALNEFRITTPERANNTSLQGNLLVLNDASGKLNMEGILNLFHSTDNNYAFSAGIGEVDLSTNTYSFNTFIGFNFPMPPQALTVMGSNMADLKMDQGAGSGEAEDDKEVLYKKLAAIGGNNVVRDYKNKAARNQVPLVNVYKKLATTLVLSHVDFQWSEENKAFYSIGKIGVSNVGNIDVNTKFDGFVEIRKNPNGDEVSILIEVTPDVWYYMGFEQNQLGVLSSNEEFNEVIASKSKGNVRANQYAFIPASMDEKTSFKERFQRDYMGINKPLEVKKTEEKKEKEKEEKKDGF